MAHPDKGTFNQQVNKGADTLRNLLTTVGEIGLLALSLPFACGYVRIRGRQVNVHDHDGILLLDYDQTYKSDVPYDKKEHGELIDFLREGDVLPEFGKRPDGKRPIHRHRNITGSSGSQEYRYE